MVTVFTCPGIIEIYEVRTLLEDANIECVINNEHVSFLAGEVPFAATWPQLDLLNESDLERAQGIVENRKKVPVLEDQTAWECSSCGESHEPQFTICWKCSSENH